MHRHTIDPAPPALLRLLAVAAAVLTLTVSQAQESQREFVDRIEPLKLGDVGAGELLWRSDRGYLPLPTVDLDVELTVSGMMIHGKVTQRFDNPTGELLEALYVFPLPDRAAVHSMVMQIGERRIVSVIEEREQARRTYTEARASGKQAALVEQQRPNLFTTMAANINPGESVIVELEYVEQAGYTGQAFHLRFPLCYTPRFFPGGSGHTDPAPSLPRARVTVTLDPGLALETVSSRSHTVSVTEKSGRYRIEPTAGWMAGDRDFLLGWRPRLGEEPRAAGFVEERDDGRYAMIMLMPPIPGSEAGLGLPTETLFVIDVSGSMEGPSIVQAREALIAALERLRPDDRFNVMRFNDGNSLFRPAGFLDASPQQLAEARAWVERLDAGGGTQIYPALMRGLDLLSASSWPHAQRLVFLTDGAVGNEQEVLRGIVDRIGDARLHTLGIGHAPNSWLMRKMAQLGHGVHDFVATSGEAENRIDAFFARLDRPVLQDLQLEWDGAQPDDVLPTVLPDLYAGEPLVISARLPVGSETHEIRVGGWTRAGWIATSAGLGRDAPLDGGVALRWARARVEALNDTLYEGADPDRVRAEVIDLALAHHLVTRYTSLVAVEQVPTALGDATRVRVAGALPRGGSSGPLSVLVGLLLTGAGALLWVTSRCWRS